MESSGQWTFEHVLGSGGLTTVYSALDASGERHAVKVLQRAYARDAGICAEMLERAEAVRRVRHEGIVEVRAVDNIDGAPAIVMELLDGENLAAKIGASEVDTDELLRIVDDLLGALIAAHGEDVVHGHVTPANVFVCRSGQVKLLDFGVAPLIDLVRRNVRRRLGDRLGCAGYMPPEQIHGCHYNERGDLFAVGAMMFHTIAHALVHPATSEANLMVRMGTEPARPLSTVAPHASEGVCLVVDRALAFWSTNRYPNAYTMRRDIQALRRGAAPRYATEHKDADPREKPPSRPQSVAERQPWRDTASADTCKAPASSLFTREPGTPIETRMLGTTLAGRYQLVSLLGRGGMGAVFDAKAGDQRYAVKVILAEGGEPTAEARMRFQREATIAASIDSRHVVRVIEAGTDAASGLSFIVMELLTGTDLEALIDEIGALRGETAVRLALQTCRGLEAAHAQGIIHRDIKPSNLLLCDSNGEVTVRICDFGIARRALGDETGEVRLTATDTLLGTPLYASPEQILDTRSVDSRTDVWSVCLSLYEALLGHAPWAHCETQGQLLMSIVTKDIPRLDALAPGVPKALADAVHGGLRREFDERYASVAALAAALRPFAGGSEQVRMDSLLRSPATTSKLT